MPECKICGVEFDAHGLAIYCSDECRATARNRRYKTDPKYRAAQKARSKKYQSSPLGRRQHQIAFERRRKEGRLRWYEQRSYENPDELQDLRRAFNRYYMKVRRGCTQEDLFKYKRVRALMAGARRIQNWTAEGLRTIHGELDKILQEE